MMKWLGNFAENVKRYTSSKIAKEVLDGIDDIPEGSTKKIRNEQTRWIQKALLSLDSLVDQETSNKILVETCPHKYPQTRIKQMRMKLNELEDIDKLLEFMRSDTSWGGGSFYDYPHREGNWIHVTKVPYNPSKYEKATTTEEKHMSYCHCSLAKARMNEMPSTFCSCSGGWIKQLWEGVLGIPLEVKLSESILKGNDQCTHSFQIPDEILRALKQ